MNLTENEKRIDQAKTEAMKEEIQRRSDNSISPLEYKLNEILGISNENKVARTALEEEIHANYKLNQQLERFDIPGFEDTKENLDKLTDLVK